MSQEAGTAPMGNRMSVYTKLHTVYTIKNWVMDWVRSGTADVLKIQKEKIEITKNKSICI